jgi:hypothetical protein
MAALQTKGAGNFKDLQGWSALQTAGRCHGTFRFKGVLFLFYQGFKVLKPKNPNKTPRQRAAAMAFKAFPSFLFHSCT